MAVHLHADDLGLHPSVDRAIFRAFEGGAIAGASLLVTGPTFHEAARQARALRLPTSLHLALVDERPVSPPAEVPSLIDADGRFPPTFSAVAGRALLGRLRQADLRLEIGRQVEAFAGADLVGNAGLVVDGHQHLHLLPPVVAVLLESARRFGLTAIRLPRRSPTERRERSARALGFVVAERLGRRAAAAAAAQRIATIPCWGVLYAGHLTVDRARAVLASLPSDATGQLLCHPGDDDRALGACHAWGYAWEGDLSTIMRLASEPDPSRS